MASKTACVQLFKQVEKGGSICIWQAEMCIMLSANGSLEKKNNPRTSSAKAAGL